MSGHAHALGGDFQDALLVMDVVDELRRQEQHLAQFANADSNGQAIKERLRQLYKANGIDVSDDVLDRAVQAKLDERFVYHPPARSLQTRLAGAYINRSKLAPYTLPIAIGCATVGVGYELLVAMPAERAVMAQTKEINSGIALWKFVADERQVEAMLLGKALGKLAEPPALIKVPVKSRVSQALASLELATDIAKRADNTQPPEQVTTETVGDAYGQRRAALNGHEKTLAEADAEIAKASALYEEVRTLFTLNEQFEAIQSGEKSLLPAIAERVTGSLDQTERALRAGDIARAKTSLVGAQEAIKLQGKFAELGARIAKAEKLAASSNPTPAAAGEIKRLKDLAENALGKGELALAQTAVDEFEVKAHEVAQDLTFVVVTNGKSGVWRHPNSNKNARNYYLIVEAKRPNGEVVPMRVTNEETGKTSTVRQFGVRVPEATFEAVKADKMDNGIVERNKVAHKPRGSLGFEPILRIEQGRITNW